MNCTQVLEQPKEKGIVSERCSIKSFLSGIYTFTCTYGYFDGANRAPLPVIPHLEKMIQLYRKKRRLANGRLGVHRLPGNEAYPRG